MFDVNEFDMKDSFWNPAKLKTSIQRRNFFLCEGDWHEILSNIFDDDVDMKCQKNCFYMKYINDSSAEIAGVNNSKY